MTKPGHPWLWAPEEGSERHKRQTLASFSDERKPRPDAKMPANLHKTASTQTWRSLVRSAAVRRPAVIRALLLATVPTVLAALIVPAVGGADSASQLRQNAAQLQRQNAFLAQRSHSAVVGLYSLDSKLAAAHSRVSSLQSEIASIQQQQAAVRQQLAIVRRVLAVSQRQLSRRLVSIYEQGEPDPLAVVLGAQSIDAALTGLDDLNAVAGQNKSMLVQARQARVSLGVLRHSLAVRQERLGSLEAQAAAAAGALDAARSNRLAYIAQLGSQQRLNNGQISTLESQASAAQSRANAISAQQALAPPPAPAAAPTPAPTSTPAGGRTLTVVATAYALPGSTATGLPVGPGIVAVDPNVIPLGTHMTIPGYGEGVAADTGSAIIGARIDVWVPTEAQANAWGVKTVTITLH
jgi:peptidoglycan DL-endopeptidase CwlO